jgi:hypothetical protein
VIIVRDWKCLESPNAPVRVVVAVTPPSVRPKQPLQPSPEMAVAISSQCREETVPHQTATEDLHPQSGVRAIDGLHKGVVFGRFVEDLLAAIAAVWRG